MESLVQDVRFALRSLRASRGTVAIAIVCLALGIGANTAIFSVVEAVLLASLPYRDEAGLVRVYETSEGVGRYYASPANYFDWRAQHDIFADLAAFGPVSRDLGDATNPERVRGIRATSNLFMVLGTQPLTGRVFLPSDELPGQPPVVVISEGLWRRRFGADPGIVGAQIPLNNVKHTVIGVMPSQFDFPLSTLRNDIWTVIEWSTMGQLTNRMNHSVQVVGRLAPGLDSASAMARLIPFAQRLEQAYPESQKSRGVLTVSMSNSIVGNVRTALLVLLGAVGLVLLIACANVANLMLARAAGRRREVAIRTALGASRGRLVRQLMTESGLLAVAGGALGLVVAQAGLRALITLAGTALPRVESVRLDGRVLLFAACVSIATGLVFGIVPAMRATRTDLREDLSDAAGRSSAGAKRHRTLNALIAGEIALSLMVLMGAGLIIRSFMTVIGADAGFRTEGVLTFRASAPAGRFADSVRYSQFYGPVLERLRSLPGVRAAGFTNLLPIQDGTTDSFIRIIGQAEEADPTRRPDAEVRYVSSAYFKTLGIQLRSGREFTDQDNATTPRVMVVNEELVRRFLPGENPIGKQIDPGTGQAATIVGVVRAVRQMGLDRPPLPELYLAAPQIPGNLGAITFVVSSDDDPEMLAAAVRATLHEIAPTQPVYQLGSMAGVIAESLKSRKLILVLLAGFAVLALVLSAAGVYGVMSYGVTQRRREIGIRMALGARGADVTGMVLRDVTRIMAIGVGAGVVGAALLSRVLETMLYGVGAHDPITFFVVPVIIGGVALLAGAVPALRAARVDPVVAMRME